MPYIQKTERADIDNHLRAVLEVPLTAGQLSYTITRIVLQFIRWHSNKLTYVTCVMAVGVLVLTTFEIIRRVVNPYEKEKIKENGDIDYFEF